MAKSAIATEPHEEKRAESLGASPSVAEIAPKPTDAAANIKPSTYYPSQKGEIATKINRLLELHTFKPISFDKASLVANTRG